MTSFTHVEKIASCPGTVRGAGRIRAGRRNLDRGLAALLLAAIVASMFVVADRLMSTSQEGALLVAWVVLWGIAFVALALFAGRARTLAIRFLAPMRGASRRRAAARADEIFMAHARHDPRMFSELTAIATRRQVEAEASTAA